MLPIMERNKFRFRHSRVTLVIDILNKTGLRISYNELQRTDFGHIK